MASYIKEVCDEIYNDDRYNGLNPLYLELHYAINYILNLIVALSLLYFTKNIVVMLIGFVIFDFIMTTFNHYYFFVRWPKKLNSMSLEERKKYIDDVIKKYGDELEDLKYHDNYRVKTSIRYYCTWLESEKKKIESEEASIREALVKTDTTTSKDYSDKMEYFNNVILKLDYYYKVYKLKSLKSIKNSVSGLVETLTKKPVGFTLINYSVYIYLDEIQAVLLQLESLDKEIRISYFDRISEVSDLLSKSLEDLNMKILKMETKPIDLTLDVLYKELSMIQNDNMDEKVEKEEEDGCIKVE